MSAPDGLARALPTPCVYGAKRQRELSQPQRLHSITALTVYLSVGVTSDEDSSPVGHPAKLHRHRSRQQPQETMGAMRAHHHIYVIELHPDVALNPKFSRANPGYVPGRLCVYVGMTGLDPDTRFDQHMAGIKANHFVTRYGVQLLPQLVSHLKQPMSYADAQYMEVDTGIRLRGQGYGVWQA